MTDLRVPLGRGACLDIRGTYDVVTDRMAVRFDAGRWIIHPRLTSDRMSPAKKLRAMARALEALSRRLEHDSRSPR